MATTRRSARQRLMPATFLAASFILGCQSGESPRKEGSAKPTDKKELKEPRRPYDYDEPGRIERIIRPAPEPPPTIETI